MMSLSLSICFGAELNNPGYSIIPLNFIRGMPIADVKLNGEDVELLIDTGTAKAYTMVYSGILKKISAQYIETVPNQYLMNFRRQRYLYKKYNIQKFSIGQYDLTNIESIEYPGALFFSTNQNSKLLTSALNNGTVGIELLKHYSIIFDYPHSRMIISTSNQYPLDYDVSSWKKFPFEYNQSGHVITQAKINNKLFRVTWDTGASLSITSPAMAAQIGTPENCASSDNTTLDNSHCMLIKTPDFIFGEQNYGSQMFYVTQVVMDNFDISIGSSFFQNHIVFFDFTKKVMAIE